MSYLLWSEKQEKYIVEAEVAIVCIDQHKGQKIAILDQFNQDLRILKK